MSEAPERRNCRTIYQLWADGCSLNGWRFTMKSKAVFAHRDDAVAYMAEFRDKCVDETYFEAAKDNDTLKIEIREFDLYE